VRALDAMLSCGRGQRLGIFAGSGVGKSSLLGMIARSTRAQVNVVALIGERGREVREFIDRHLGPEALRRAVIEGEQVLDMRHFEITPPAVAMLRIYPEVRVQLHLEADVALHRA